MRMPAARMVMTSRHRGARPCGGGDCTHEGRTGPSAVVLDGVIMDRVELAAGRIIGEACDALSRKGT